MLHAPRAIASAMLVAREAYGAASKKMLASASTAMRLIMPTARLGWAPVAVSPEAQGRGIGDALCRAGIEALRALGVEAVVVLGHPDYYPRFGFSAAAAKPLASPYAGSPAFMAMELAPGALAEPLKADYPAAFG